jgi:hypothetical protein
MPPELKLSQGEADPGARFTRIQGSKLWRPALLEWWLRLHVDGMADPACPGPV